MAIIVQADIEAIFGATNVAIWSNLDSDSTTVVTARITWAIATAEDYLSDCFRNSRYAVPLTPLSGTHSYTVKRWAAVIAGDMLYSSRATTSGESPTGPQRAAVESDITCAVAGTKPIPYALVGLSLGNAPFVVGAP